MEVLAQQFARSLGIADGDVEKILKRRVERVYALFTRFQSRARRDFLERDPDSSASSSKKNREENGFSPRVSFGSRNGTRSVFCGMAPIN